ncbi:neprilysin-1-like [Dermacentor variabilis]|uniref:neprilysin-1-like n=1 Tax=Dermacentor variabilis TaxID=34621 RepID=UPI003F5BC23C
MEEEAEVSIVEHDHRRRRGAKPFYYGTALVLFVSASFCAAAYLPGVFSRRVYVMDEVVCASSSCQALSRLINGSVNGDLDPCDDFYAYVCDGWRRSHSLRPSESRRSVFDEVEQSVRARLHDALWKTFRQSLRNRTGRNVFAKLATVYAACAKSLTPEGNGVVSMRKFLKHMNLAWPDEEAPQGGNATDLLELLVTLSMRWDVNVLFSYSVRSLSKEKGAIVLGLPAPLIPGRLTDAKKSLYEKLIVSLAFLFGRRSEYNDFARRLVAVEQDIARLRDQDHVLLTYMVKDLGNLCADFPWQKWMSALNKNLPPQAALTAQKSVIVRHPAYIGRLLTYFLGHEYPEDIKAYLAFRVLLRYGQAIYDIRHVQDIVLHAEKDVPADEVMRTCQQWLADLMLDTWNSFVSQSLAKRADIERLTQLVSDIKNVFYRRVRRAEWMDAATKNISVQKAQNIAFNIPSFEKTTALDKAYESLLSDARGGSSFLDLVIRLVELNHEIDELSLYGVIGRSDSATVHSRVNAMYVYSLNVVNVNAALLALPFFAQGAPLSVTYGSLGAIVAHEIIHGFDVSGRLYDEVGSFEDWWSNATNAAYREASACFVEQMRSLATSENAGSVTLEENTADNGGARCAYEAYVLAAERALNVVQLRGLEAFEEEQLFFVAYCYKFCGIERPSSATRQFATHPADKLRCNVPLLNMPEFAAAFECEPGAAMNPARRCTAW